MKARYVRCVSLNGVEPSAVCFQLECHCNLVKLQLSLSIVYTVMLML